MAPRLCIIGEERGVWLLGCASEGRRGVVASRLCNRGEREGWLLDWASEGSPGGGAEGSWRLG